MIDVMRACLQHAGAVVCLVGGLVLLYWNHDFYDKDQALGNALGLYMAGKGLFLFGVSGSAGAGKKAA